MRIKSQFTQLGIYVLAACLVGGCGGRGGVDPQAGSTPSSSSSSSASGVTIVPNSSKSQPRNFVADSFDKGIDANSTLRYTTTLRTDPVPPGRSPTFSSAQAISAALAANFPKDLQPGAPQIALRSVTLGDEVSKTSTFLGWVLVWSGSRPDIKGPPPGQGKRGSVGPVPALTCTFVMVVDATTLELRDVEQLCGPQS